MKNNLDSNKGPNYFVDGWADFVMSCEEGYQYTASEYDYDLMIRDDIEKIFRAEELTGFEAFNIFKERIKPIDDAFKSCLHPAYRLPIDTPYWWQKGVLKYAGKDYAEQIKHFGFAIEVVG